MNDKKPTESAVRQPKDQRSSTGELDQEQLDHAAGGMMTVNDVIRWVKGEQSCPDSECSPWAGKPLSGGSGGGVRG